MKPVFRFHKMSLPYSGVKCPVSIGRQNIRTLSVIISISLSHHRIATVSAPLALWSLLSGRRSKWSWSTLTVKLLNKYFGPRPVDQIGANPMSGCLSVCDMLNPEVLEFTEQWRTERQERLEEAAHQQKKCGEERDAGGEGRGASLEKVYKHYHQSVAPLHIFFLKGLPLQPARFHPKADNRIVLRWRGWSAGSGWWRRGSWGS